ncbi:type II toxin-antitoxin system death-on-curing family toxin [Geobacillus thermocatenulatus]|uniref:type II toxin-antitoxin system death-on-curing family toxin n=1 Tax=Geobacillus thermocatenulatus TaxID=33938 RepID=UPI00210F2D75|nr:MULTISPECIES: type II toxin-antitoxin system death-on-curing family toxin [Geobacillus]
MATGHYFSDGNKRTAVMVAYSFLMKNGYELMVSDDELFERCIKVAKKERWGLLTELTVMPTWLSVLFLRPCKMKNTPPVVDKIYLWNMMRNGLSAV